MGRNTEHLREGKARPGPGKQGRVACSSTSRDTGLQPTNVFSFPFNNYPQCTCSVPSPIYGHSKDRILLSWFPFQGKRQIINNMIADKCYEENKESIPR